MNFLPSGVAASFNDIDPHATRAIDRVENTQNRQKI
jgi:hypothetical protein